jgi:hypothetical protein
MEGTYLHCRDQLEPLKTAEDSARRLWEIGRAIRKDEDTLPNLVKKKEERRCAEDDLNNCDPKKKGVRSVKSEIIPGAAALAEWTRLQYAVGVAVMKNKSREHTERRYGLGDQDWIPERRTIMLLLPDSRADSARWIAYHVLQYSWPKRKYRIEGADSGSFVRCDTTTHKHNDPVVGAWTGCNGKREARDSIAARGGRARESVTHAEIADFVIAGRNNPFVDDAWITCANGCCEFQN